MRWALPLGGLAAVLVVVVIVLASTSGGSGAPAASSIEARVQRGDMVISITESGEVQPDQRKIISNELRWPVIIERVAEEGSYVNKGDLIIEFSCQELVDAVEEENLDVQSSGDDYASAESSHEIAQMQAANEIRKAEQKVIDAKDDKEKYTDEEKGEWKQTRDDLQSDIYLAEQDLTQAQRMYSFKVEANSDPELNKPYSDRDLDAERLKVERLKLALARAQAKDELTHKYTHPRKLRDLDSAITDAELALAATKVEQQNKVNLAKSRMVTAESMLKRHRDLLKEYQEDFDQSLRYVAEEPGLVVYDTNSRRFDSVVVDVGETIPPRQQLMIIPDMGTLQVETKVYEASREQVQPGLPATIRLDARRDLILSGAVTKVSQLPDSQGRWWSPDVKAYPTVVKFDGDVAELKLKPGMTAEVEITLDTLNDVLFVPISAVFSEQDVTFCYRRSGRDVERIPITIGKSSETYVQIVSGLEEGDVVLLAPPADFKDKVEFKPSVQAQTPVVLPPQPRRREAGSQPSEGRQPGTVRQRPAGARPTGGGGRGPRGGGSRG